MTTTSFGTLSSRALALAITGPVVAVLMMAESSLAQAAGACDATTAAASKACNLAAEGDYNISLGICANVTSPTARQQCNSQAAQDLADAQKLCTDQQAARRDVCNTLGQAPYDPLIRASDFVARIDNPLLPMRSGDIRIFRGRHSTVTVTVTDQTIRLLGVTCIVVRDVKRVDGEIEEDTSDYYAQKRDGSVWYFGEDTIAYDNGIASTEGSWRAGVDGAKPGIVMFANPAFGNPPLGTTYRQEFLLGIAEDMAKTVAINQHVRVPVGTFDNAFETLEFSTLEPGSAEHKYYVPSIGQVLTVDLQTGEREELVAIIHR
jgi:hypothetical protein